MNHAPPALILFLLLSELTVGHAGQSTGPSPSPAPNTGPAFFRFIRGDDWATGSDLTLGGVLFPHLHFASAYGTSSGDPEELAAGHHDPNRKGVTVQNMEFGASLRAGDHVEGFITYAAVIDQEDQWLGSVEEAFGRIKDLPGGFELRGGRYYNRFGLYNGVHPHACQFVNRDLLEARMLGEDAVTTEGGELAWRIPGNSQWAGAVSLSYGRVVPEEEEQEGGGHFIASKRAVFSDRLFSADARVIYHHNDFHQWTGIASFMTGDNFFHRSTQAGALGLEYLWRENGLEPGGRFLRWRTEAMYRRAGAVSTAESREPVSLHTLDEAGISTAAIYGFSDKFNAGLGIAWVEGISEAGLPGRCRISPVMQWNLSENMNLRLQYDHDRAMDSASEDSVWMQFNVSWGGHEAH